MPIQKVDKQSIVKSALQVFKEHGYHKTSMADLGKACGLLKGSIYHYFSGKQALMNEVIDYLSDAYRSKIFSVKDDKSKEGKEKLAFLIEQSENIFLTDKGGCLMASIGLETVNVVPEFTTKIRSFFNDWITCFTEIFSEKHSSEEAKALAEQGVAEIEGAVMLMQLFQDEHYLHNAHNRILHRFMNNSAE